MPENVRVLKVSVYLKLLILNHVPEGRDQRLRIPELLQFLRIFAMKDEEYGMAATLSPDHDLGSIA